MSRTVFINEDDSHFTSCHPREDMTREGIERLVDYFVEDTQVGGVLFCVNYQKALYRSKVWEYLCDGYDPHGPDDQPFLKNIDLSTGGHGRHMLDNMLTLDAQRIDRHQIWLDRCRHHGVEGWLTVRMNDCHGLQEHRRRFEAGDGDYRGWALMFPSKLWKSNPPWRRAGYREERSLEGAFNFAIDEVRRHHLALIAEVLDRWAMDGIELDWMRWGMNFAPGQEAAGRAILTDFMGQVRDLTDRAQRRRSRPIRLGVRVPDEIEVCEALGYDPLAWSERKLVDQVVLSWFGGRASYTQPIALWRRLFGPDVRILSHCCGVVTPYPEFGLTRLVGHDDVHRGVASSLLHRGADGLYLFNDCYAQSSRPDEFKQLLQQIGSPATLAVASRSHVLTHSSAAPGVPSRHTLPAPLANAAVGYDYARLEDAITLRIDTGTRPGHSDTVLLYLGFSAPPQVVGEVRCNGRLIQPVSDDGGCLIHRNSIEHCAPGARAMFVCWLCYRILNDCLQQGENALELVGFQGSSELRWAEVCIRPTR
jgi:hypothetical protein